MSGTSSARAARSAWARTLFGVAALGAVAILAFTLASRSEAGDEALLSREDSTAITALISGYDAGYCKAFVVPPDARKAVEARQAQLRADPRPAVQEGEPHLQVLPDTAMAEMNRTYRDLLDAYCTKRYAEARLRSTDWAAIRDVGLHNNPSDPLLVDYESRVLAVECKKRSASHCIVWALTWGGEVTAQGRRIQGWSVSEYRLVLETGMWLIDSEILIAGMTATSSEWGPYSAREPIDQCEPWLLPARSRAPRGRVTWYASLFCTYVPAGRESER